MGENFLHEIMQYNYSKQIFRGRAKPIRIIGDPDNQLPDNWSSTVLVLILEKEAEFKPYVTPVTSKMWAREQLK